MKISSHVLLTIAKRMPRGYWRLIRTAAKRDPELSDFPLRLKFVPLAVLRGDLREPIFAPFLRHGCFPHQVGEDRICMAILRAGDRVFDVGSNIGYPTILFASIVGDSGLVVALEPSKRAFYFLKRSFGDRSNMKILQLAASDVEGETSFFETSTLDTSSLESVPNVAPYSVKTITIDGLVKTYGIPTFVKIDVEGHEPSVLRGMRDLLADDRPPILMFEALNRSSLEGSLGVIEQFASSHFDHYRILDNGRLSHPNALTGTNNFLCIPTWAETRIKN